MKIPGMQRLPLCYELSLGQQSATGPSDVISAAHSVTNEKQEQIPTRPKYHNPKDARYHEDVIPEFYCHIGAALLRERKKIHVLVKFQVYVLVFRTVLHQFYFRYLKAVTQTVHVHILCLR